MNYQPDFLVLLSKFPTTHEKTSKEIEQHNERNLSKICARKIVVCVTIIFISVSFVVDIK